MPDMSETSELQFEVFVYFFFGDCEFKHRYSSELNLLMNIQFASESGGIVARIASIDGWSAGRSLAEVL